MVVAHQRLKEDVDLVGRILGQVIHDQCGVFYFETVENIRRLSKQTRSQNRIAVQEKIDEISAIIRSLSPDESVIVSRAFSHFLNLVNIVETVHEPDVLVASEELLQTFERLKKSEHSDERIREALTNMQIDLVLTAHPTEVKRRTLIQKHTEVARILKERIKANDFQIEELNQQLHELITNIWETDDIRRKRPTPLEEAKWGCAVVEETLWQTVPWYLRRLDTLLNSSELDSLDPLTCPIKMSSWVGGDRDGNPFVTAKVTEEVVLMTRITAMRLYIKDIDQLVRQLSVNECSDAFRQDVGPCHEPYRVFLSQFNAKLSQTLEWLTECYREGEYRENNQCVFTQHALLEPLLKVRESLLDVKIKTVADGFLLDVIRRVQTFGVVLLPLDIRQESTRHQNVIARLCDYLEIGHYLTWDEDKKCEFLISELQNKRPILAEECPFDPQEQEVVDTIKLIARLPYEQFGAYVISMASTASDVLAVCLIQKMCGVKKLLRVVPLFETLDDLNHASTVLSQLFNYQWYVERFNYNQEVMIGYSDSGKDAGKIAASWGLYCAQEKMLETAQKHNVNLVFFHGRGGTVGRGGGPVRAGLLSQPPGTVAGKMRVTEQGEVIQQKFGSLAAARRNFLTYIGSVLEASLLPPQKPKEAWRLLMDKMSSTSRDAYRQTVFNDEKFIEYFHTATPEQELGRLCIGSRPAKRKPKGGVESLRAIPWIFAWTQVRLLLPAWLGAEKAFENVLKEDDYQLVCTMVKEWAFFHNFMDALNMVLSKADRKMSSFYDRLLLPDELLPYGQQIRDKLTEMKEFNLKISEDLDLSHEREILRTQLHYRNTYLDPLNWIQAEMMHRLKFDKFSDKTEKLALEDALMITIAGISAGLKNTG